MSDRDRDTQPPSPRDSSPSIPRTDVERMLSEVTTRFIGEVGRLLDPPIKILQSLSDTVMNLQHRLNLISQELERGSRRFATLEQRVSALEERCDECPKVPEGS